MELLYFASQRPNALDVLQIRSRQNQQIDQFPLTARNSHTIHSGDSAIRGRVRIVYLPQPYLPSHLEGTLQPSPVLPLPSGSSSRGLAYSVDPSPVRAVYIAHAIQAAAEVSAPCRSKPSERPWQDLRRVGFHGRCWSSQDEIRCTDLPRTLSYIHRPSSTPACRAFSSIAFRATTKRCVIFVCVIDFLVISWAHRFTVCFYDTTMKFSRRLCMPMASSFLPPVLSIHLLALTCKHADQSCQCPVLPMACVGEFLGCLVSPLVWQTGTDGPTTTYFPAPQVNIQVYPRPSRVRSHASLSKYTAPMVSVLHPSFSVSFHFILCYPFTAAAAFIQRCAVPGLQYRELLDDCCPCCYPRIYELEDTLHIELRLERRERVSLLPYLPGLPQSTLRA